MRFLLRSFLRGLLIVLPVGLTVYVVVTFFLFLDGLVPRPESWTTPARGLGVAVIFFSLVVVGWLGSNFFAKRLVRIVDKSFAKLPLVKLIYNSLRDLIGAFVGDKKKFDTPVTVQLTEGSEARVLGFITRRELDFLGIDGHVAVYMPQSYNFAGQVIVVPEDNVMVLDADPADVMAFIVSGGVSGSKAGMTLTQTQTVTAR